MSGKATQHARRRTAICNTLGLHARASRMFVTTAGQFKAEVQVACDGQTVPANSVLSLLELAAPKGSEIEIIAEGPEAEDAVEALADLVEAGFYEKDDHGVHKPG